MCCENEVSTSREGCHGHGPKGHGRSGRGHHHSARAHHHGGRHPGGHPSSGRAGRCCCSEESPASWRRFESSEERKEKLKRYIEELEHELQGAKERLEEL
ncbi:MAG: hypothetical protein V5A81_03320 [Candidatus Bipolaricaulota bacterium]